MEEAKEYARLIRIRGGHADVCRIRMFDGHRYNWHHQVCCDGILYKPTDQTYVLGANYSSDLNYWDEVWIDGVRVHKKAWWRKMLFLDAQ